MKIKTAQVDLDHVMKQSGYAHEQPMKPGMFFRTLLKVLSASELKKTNFSYKTIGMDRLGKDEPCLFLMNHSAFIDLKIAATVLYPRPFNIVCTYDGFVGKRGLMRRIGCIPTHKFISDPMLIRDMAYAVRKLKSSVLMFPEATYSFDGTSAPLPESLGTCLKILQVPVVMIRTQGAFIHDPLYNALQLRRTDVSATVEYILSPQDIREKNTEELNRILAEKFEYDHFRQQRENDIKVTEPFRADCLNRVLYRCPACRTKGQMAGKGTQIACGHCGKTYELTETGSIRALEGETEFDHIPDWYRWQRACVRSELESGTFRMELPVDIYMMVNTDCVYSVGEGTLTHTPEGFRLTGCSGKIDHIRHPLTSYSLYSDFYWYEIGDMICIGDAKVQYYCFPKTKDDVAAEARLAAEEHYKICREQAF